MKTACVLVSKWPRFGVGKQRLAHEIGQQHALSVAQLLFACALDDLSICDGESFYFLNERPAEFPSHIDTHKIIVQPEGNLGERINYVDAWLRSQGFEHTVYIGSDCPLLTSQDYQTVQQTLLTHDSVLIPSTDGGVTLMANAKPWPCLKNLPWSDELLAKALVQHITAHDFKTIKHLPENYDIDNKEDLLKLETDLAHDNRATRQAITQWLKQAQENNSV